jgi:hypothetical protein
MYTVSYTVKIRRLPPIDSDRCRAIIIYKSVTWACYPIVHDSPRWMSDHSHSMVPGGFEVTS